MKPSILVKTVNGKQYLQLRTVEGILIHIGPASKPETWRVAHRALREEYDSLRLNDMMSLVPIAIENGIDPMQLLSYADPKSPEKPI